MSSFSENDRKFVWHPFTQMKTASAPLPVIRAESVWLFTEDGKKYLDANSSWWTNIHGHGNKYIADKIHEQFLKIDHIIFAGVSHPKAVELSERILIRANQHYQKVFFSDNGSTSVEVALKMVYQYWYNLGQTKKRFLALQGAYHGDTFGAMSVGERGYFNKPFEHLFFDVDYVDFPDDQNGEAVLSVLEKLFSTGEFAGFIFEPLVQGAAGMRIYSAEWLDKAIDLAKKYQVLTIGDEVMTGFYRTGKFLATDYLSKKPDIICLSKGLTGGVLPLGLTLATQKIFDAFLHEETTKALLHGHSFTGNAIACAAACASLDLLDQKQTQEKVDTISKSHQQFVIEQMQNPKFSKVKSIGTILSIELKTKEAAGYFVSVRDQAYQYFLTKGFLIRPLGNVIFLNPPYCISEEELRSLYQVILEFAETKE